jgi:hypothetical protein
MIIIIMCTYELASMIITRAPLNYINDKKEHGIEGNFKEIVEGIFDTDAKGITSGTLNLVLNGVQEFLGNYAIGESELQDMVIMWSNNVLLRVDLYYWKWSFLQLGVFHCVKKNVLAVYCIKRVIGIAEVNSTQCRNLGHFQHVRKERSRR